MMTFGVRYYKQKKRPGHTQGRPTINHCLSNLSSNTAIMFLTINRTIATICPPSRQGVPTGMETGWSG